MKSEEKYRKTKIFLIDTVGGSGGSYAKGHLEQEVVEAALGIAEGGSDATAGRGEVHILRSDSVELFADSFDGFPRRRRDDDAFRPAPLPVQRGSDDSAMNPSLKRAVANRQSDRGRADRHWRACEIGVELGGE